MGNLVFKSLGFAYNVTSMFTKLLLWRRSGIVSVLAGSWLLWGYSAGLAAPAINQIPVAAEVDVVIAGGGCGAVAAAVSAAKAGASVFLAAPHTYLGEDMAGTMQLWLEPGETPATALAQALYTDEDDAGVRGFPFSYKADQITNPKHKDTWPPSRLNSHKPIQNPVTDSVQYDTNVTITADLRTVQTVKEAQVTLFYNSQSYAASSIRVSISEDGKQWKDLGTFPCHNLKQVVNTPIPIMAKLRFAKFLIKRTPSSERLLVGGIKFLPVDSDEPAQKVPVVIRPMHVKATLENALITNKVDYLYGCYATELLVDKTGKPAGIVMANRSGRQAVIAKVVIDATENAALARLAGAEFAPFKAGKQTVKWVTIAAKSRAPKSGTVRTLPFKAIVMSDKGIAPTGSEASWFEYTLKLDLASDDWPSRGRLEQEVRNQVFDPSQYYSSDVPWWIAPTAIKAVASAPSDWPGAAKLSLEVCQPAGVERLWVLSTCAGVSRAAAEKLMRPSAAMELGERLGVVAAKAAKGISRVEGVQVKPSTLTADYSGTIQEPLDGLRPLPVPPRVPETVGGLPVLGRYDVVVAGGGTSGAAAGIGAARGGAKTLQIEYLHGLGGVGTLGMIGKWWYGNRVGFTATVPQNPLEVRMEWLRSELIKAGGELWFGCMANGVLVEGNQVKGVIVVTPYGRGVVLAKVVVDGTGNADLAAPAGAETRFVEDFFALQDSHIPPREVGSFYINGGLAPVDVADPLDVRQALAQRKQKFFDRGQLVDSRERRSIVGDYTLDWLDQINRRTFPDSIAFAQSDYDSHGYQIHPYFMLRPTRPPENYKHQYYSFVPYRCLLPRGVENILVVGTALSVHRDALPIVRMQPDLQNIGYTAGTAAAMAVKGGITPRQVDVKALQKHLVEIGNLSASVLIEKDSYPISKKELTVALQTVLKDYDGVQTLMAQPADSLPLLRQAHDQAGPEKRFTYAHILGIMGDAHGIDTLISEAKRRLQMKDFTLPVKKGQMDPVVQLIWALGGTGDRRVVPVLCEMAEATARNSGVRLRALVVSLGRLHDPAAASTLVGLVKSRNQSGDALELMAACALSRCGDVDGLAKSTLEKFVRGANGPFSKLAWQVLSDRSKQ